MNMVRPITVFHNLSLFILLSPSSNALQEKYAHARSVRIQHGTTAAVPLYQHILIENPHDCTTATHLAASISAQAQLEQACFDTSRVKELRKLLVGYGFTTNRIANQFGLQVTSGEVGGSASNAASCIGPIFVSPVAAGAATSLPWRDDHKPTALECLIALFLVGLAITRLDLEEAMSIKNVELLLATKVLAFDEARPETVFAILQICPLSFAEDKTLYLLTDWHPRVLSQTSITSDEDAVMYIGPDSLALVQHFLMNDDKTDTKQESSSLLLDVCTGSGIQALAALMLGKCDRAVCLDVNPRCLRFTNFNAALNGLDDCIELICGDLIAGESHAWPGASKDLVANRPLTELLHPSTFHTITANPPFLPVPPAIPTKRHGLFSAGGSTGEVVLASIVELAAKILVVDGTLALVSEFFLDQPYSADPLLRRIQHWLRGQTVRGLLLTNELPIDAATYAERRSDSVEELDMWMEHLDSQGIRYASPGLLYLQRTDPSSKRDTRLEHVLVPRSKSGSIWSPANWSAVEYTRQYWRRFQRKEV